METLLPLILTYRYWIIIPLTFLEGPIVALFAGTLAAAGYFDIYFLAAVFFVRDILMDGVYYAIGHYGGNTHFVKRLLTKVGVEEGHLDDVRRLWERHPAKTMFIGKISYGIASSFITLAGMVGMNLYTFFGYGIAVAIFQYGALLSLGYFYGNMFGGDILKIIENIQYAIAAVALLATVYYFMSKRARRSFIESQGSQRE